MMVDGGPAVRKEEGEEEDEGGKEVGDEVEEREGDGLVDGKGRGEGERVARGVARGVGGVAAAEGEGDADMDDAMTDLSFLRSQPQFQQLRAMVRANPEMLQPLLQQVNQANPMLLQLINEHAEEFVHMINEGGDAPGAGAAGGMQQPGVIQVTAAEKAAIDRLQQLGFPRQLVIG